MTIESQILAELKAIRALLELALGPVSPPASVHSASNSGRWMTVAELAEKLHVSPTTVYARTAAGVWPYTRIGARSLRFSPDQVHTIVTAGQNRDDAATSQEQKRRARALRASIREASARLGTRLGP